MRFKVLNLNKSRPANRRNLSWNNSVALAAGDGAGAAPWLLMNLSGPVAARLDTDPALAGLARLAPAEQPVLLTDAQLDQVAGLISLRGGAPIDLYATPSVFEDLTITLPVLPELQRHCGVHWHMVPVAGDCRIADFQVRGQDALAFTAFDTGPGSQGCVGDPASPPPGHSIAVGVHEHSSGRRAVFARGLGVMALGVLGALDGVDCLLVDPGSRHEARAQGELAAWMAGLSLPRKVMVGGPARELAALGIESAEDGAEIVV
jgi:pyrroloquinoline quinone biosynthesis protein B